MNTDRTWHIYTLSDPRSQAVRYVGWCFNPKLRMQQHIKDCRYKRNYRANWMRGLLKLGILPTMEIIESGNGDWAHSERAWIAHFRQLGCKLTNMTDGGDGSPGLYPDEATRQKMSQSHKGMKRTAESIAKSRAGMLGRPKSESHRENMSRVRRGIAPTHLIEAAAKANKGRKQSAEHVAKRIKVQIGKTSPGRKLTDDQVREIRTARGKETQRALAKRYGVGVATIHSIQTRFRYANVPD